MDAEGFIARLEVDRRYRRQIVHRRCLAARPAEYRATDQPLPEQLRVLLGNEGIERLYCHQAESYDAVGRGEDVVICTGTASGKSLSYHLPVMAGLLADGDARALYLYPAKALAHDQQGNLQRMVAQAELGEVLKPACYDGDTPTHRRAGIRRSATLLLSNPDMLHQGILPHHAKWAEFL
ncbi:MAG: DEAD/DEAH box helicase, partial [Planctomycetes bacterium]|nr:DEAD/DEAH box helicase [Planctomycetota bacterium]